MDNAVFIYPFIDLLLRLGTCHAECQRHDEDKYFADVSRIHDLRSAGTVSLAPPAGERKQEHLALEPITMGCHNWRELQEWTHGLDLHNTKSRASFSVSERTIQ